MASNPHVLAICLPLQGHINPLFQLSNRLISKGIRVTYVTTSAFSNDLQTKPEETSDDTDSNHISIESVPDSTADVTEGLDMYEAFFQSFKAAMTPGLSNIIDKYRNSGDPFTAIIFDSCIPWMSEFAHEKGLKAAALLTQSAAASSVFYHVYKGGLEISQDFKDSLSEISLPGLPVLGVRDLPTFLYSVGGFGAILTTLVEQFKAFEMAHWRLFNTFDQIEDEVLKWMAKDYKIHTIGPTVPSMYTDKRLQGNYDYGLSIFKPKTHSFLEWLDTKDDLSVIYVSFGSLVDLPDKQMEEVALGLIKSKHSFLWVVRETEQTKLPQNLLSDLMERGLIVNWCTQLEVLSHPAVGAFFSHGGWNSTLEAMVMGVPMVVMPLRTDQSTNAKMIVDVWRTGVRVKGGEDGIVMREEVAACVDEVMETEKGDEIRKNALRWKGLAIEAVSEGGSSDRNVEEFSDDLVSIHRKIHDEKFASAEI